MNDEALASEAIETMVMSKTVVTAAAEAPAAVATTKATSSSTSAAMNGGGSSNGSDGLAISDIASTTTGEANQVGHQRRRLSSLLVMSSSGHEVGPGNGNSSSSSSSIRGSSSSSSASGSGSGGGGDGGSVDGGSSISPASYHYHSSVDGQPRMHALEQALRVGDIPLFYRITEAIRAHLYRMEDTVIDDRRRRLKSVRKCFTGARFVSWLVDHGYACTRFEAATAGARLLALGVIHDVDDKLAFLDQTSAWYRFRVDDGTFAATGRFQLVMEVALHTYSMLAGSTDRTKLVSDFTQGVRTYRKCVKGSHFVDWLVKRGLCESHASAVQFGSEMCAAGFLSHVAQPLPFSPTAERFQFYLDKLEGLDRRHLWTLPSDKLLLHLPPNSSSGDSGGHGGGMMTGSIYDSVLGSYVSRPQTPSIGSLPPPTQPTLSLEAAAEAQQQQQQQQRRQQRELRQTPHIRVDNETSIPSVSSSLSQQKSIDLPERDEYFTDEGESGSEDAAAAAALPPLKQATENHHGRDNGVQQEDYAGGGEESGAGTGKKESSATAAATVTISPQEPPLPAPASPSLPSGKPRSGSTLKHDPVGRPGTWCAAAASGFSMRVGPDYKHKKQKAPSGSAMYEPVAVDYFASSERLRHYSSVFELPKSRMAEQGWSHPTVPSLLVVNVQVPDFSPSLLKRADDGDTVSIVAVFEITERAAGMLDGGTRERDEAPPILRLWRDYCSGAPDSTSMRHRFKMCAYMRNMAECNIPGVLRPFNGKPCLIREDGELFYGNGYVEMSVAVHEFPYLAQKLIYMLHGRAAGIITDIGITVEARTDEEMPERLLGAVCSNKIDYFASTAPRLNDLIRAAQQELKLAQAQK